MILLSVVMLYKIKEKTDTLKKQQAKLVRLIKEDTAALKILKIEKDYLSRPVRLERLSTRYLGLDPIVTSQFILSLDNINIGEGEDRDAAVKFARFGTVMPRQKPIFQIPEDKKSLREIFASLESNQIDLPVRRQDLAKRQNIGSIYKPPVKLTSYVYKPSVYKARAKKQTFKPPVKKIGFKDR
jgi:hypothetical protein